MTPETVPPGPGARHPNRGRRWNVVTAVTVLAILGAAAAWWLRPRATPAPSAGGDPAAEPDDTVRAPGNPGYVGPNGCAACHQAQSAEFHKTRHARACWTAEQGPMPPGFGPDRASYTSRAPGTQFAFAHTGRDYLETVERDTPAGPQRFPLRVDLIYGAHGGADEVYFTWQGDRLYEMPMAWLHPTREWGEQRFTPNHPGNMTRTATTRCIECHNTWFGHVPGTENEYRADTAVLGVTCESCHGPGRRHAEAPRAPDMSVRGIVHPGRLSRDRLMDVCAQCHSNAMRARGPAFSYRPGQPLDEHFRTLTAEGRENDHVAGQANYLRKSKCFQKSDTLTCVTCHDPHRPSNPAAVQGACAKCHQSNHCRDRDRLPDGVRDNCVGCHMPNYTRVAVNFHTAGDQYVFPVRPHEHRIAVYPRARQEVLLNWHRGRPDPADRLRAAQLAPELGEKWRSEADRLRKSYQFIEAIGAEREAARVHPTPDAQDRVRSAVALKVDLDDRFFAAERHFAARRFPDAIRALEDALKIKPDWAPAHGKLGTLYAATGNRPKAAEHLNAVGRHDPDDPYGHNMLGWLAYLDGKHADAVELFRRADEVNPYTAEINYRWGLALLALERWPDAANRFQKVVTIDPAHAGGYQGFSHALRRLGHAGEATLYGRKAVRLTGSKNADVLLTLADAYADADKIDEALGALDRALGAAPGAELAARIRQRQTELKARPR